MSWGASLRHLVSLVWRADRRSTVMVLLFLPITAVAFVVMSWSFKLVVDAAEIGDGGATVTPLILAALAMGAIQTCFLWQGNLERLISDKVSMELDQEALTTLDSIPGIAHLENPEHLDRVELVLDKGRDISAALWAVTDIVSTVVRLTTIGILLAAIDPLLLLLPIGVVPMLVSVAKATPIEFAAERSLAPNVRMRDVLHDLALDQTAAMEMKIYGAADELSTRSAAQADTIRRRRLTAGLKAAAVMALGWICFGVVLLGALWLTARRIVDGDGTAGDIVLVWQLSSTTLFAFQRLMWRSEAVQRSFEVLDRYMSIRTYAEAERKAWLDPSQEPAPAILRDGIQLCDVSFTYPGTDVPVLREVSLDIPAGSVVALIGGNGAGKSTLVKLLLGLYRPTAGELTLDGVSISGIDPLSWRKRTAATYQDFAKVEALVRQSVGLGDVGSIDDDERLVVAVERASADDLLLQWRRGLDTPLGKTYHDGAQPSVGQWQRLAIARAFLPPDPMLMVFDEPTSAIDPLHEAELLRSYAEAAAGARERGGVTVMISHRFLSARDADLVVVLDGGEVVEVGSHDDLVEAGGTYAETYAMQKAGYR